MAHLIIAQLRSPTRWGAARRPRIQLNFSFSADSPEAIVERLWRLTYYSPYIVPFSFSSPFVGGALRSGLSYRTYRRTGRRPAALEHLSGGPDHPLVKNANPPSQHLRIEFKASTWSPTAGCWPSFST